MLGAGAPIWGKGGGSSQALAPTTRVWPPGGMLATPAPVRPAGPHTRLSPQPEEKQKAAQQFSKLQAAMKVLGISPDEQRACWLLLAAIYHLGAAGATKGKLPWSRQPPTTHTGVLPGALPTPSSAPPADSSVLRHPWGPSPNPLCRAGGSTHSEEFHLCPGWAPRGLGRKLHESTWGLEAEGTEMGASSGAGINSLLFPPTQRPSRSQRVTDLGLSLGLGGHLPRPGACPGLCLGLGSIPVLGTGLGEAQ